MKVICALSGVQFHCDHFPATVSSQDLAHPLFYVRPDKLLSYVDTLWQDGGLTNIDSYLLFLALLESTEQIEWRVPVHRTDRTDAIVANNMERLSRLCCRIINLPNKAKVLPFFSISKESNTLDNISGWLESWEEAFNDYVKGYKSTAELQRKMDLETYLEKLIKDKSKEVGSYSQTLASWADIAGNFPRGLTPLPNGQKLPLNVYWKQIITRCCRDDSIFTIAEADLTELILHCEEEIPHGSIYAHALMHMLRTCLKRQKSFFGDGDTSFIYSEASKNTSAEQANILAIIASAPDTKPARRDYATLVSYLSAKMAWDTKCKYMQDNASTAGNEVPLTSATSSSASPLTSDLVTDAIVNEAIEDVMEDVLDGIEKASIFGYETSAHDTYMEVDTYMDNTNGGKREGAE